MAFVAGDYEAERALVGAEGLAVGGIDDQDGFGGEVVVEFGQGEDGTVAVGAFGDDCQAPCFCLGALSLEGRLLWRARLRWGRRRIDAFGRRGLWC